ncbi:MAG: ribonuclease III [Candidatus Pacebacteria bacterium]|nr:ribonuclease III [Candidatus Paceibacterota bacterium]
MESKNKERLVGVVFNNKNLLIQAFTHRSYINENRGTKLKHNERLEFLGDAVLELVTTEFLYEKFPDRNEGELTAIRAALVNTITISEVSSELDFNKELLLSKGEAKDLGRARQAILANTFEAVIGAIYLDQGYETARVFISKNLLPRTEKIIENSLWVDAKSKFQEKAQEFSNTTPVYQTLEETGPDHDKQFKVGVYIGSELVASGVGKSKQDAEQESARNGLKVKKWI